MMRVVFFISLLLLAFASRAGAVALEEYLADPADPWARTPAQWLSGETESCFRPVSDAPDSDLRYPGYANSPPVTFLGFKAYEIILRFEAGAMKGVTISLYNRGDAGDISEDDFKTSAATIEDALAAWTGQKGTLKPPQKLGANVQAYSETWPLANFHVEMKWSSSRRASLNQPSPGAAPNQAAKGFRAEYIQVVVTPPQQPQSAVSSTASALEKSASAADIRKNVGRDADGFVYIANIPMVDQGERGYCAVATAERLLKYYGKDVDQHALAQLANTGTGGGTSPEGMFNMLRRMSLKFGIKVKTHIDCTAKTILNIVDKYNLQAGKEGKNTVNPVENNIIDVNRVFSLMEPEVLHRARCERDRSGLKKFQADIVKCVDQGIPPAWSVILGIVKETPELPQSSGGHLRIIFGYNTDLKEILYTDSWGAGHEYKRMSFEAAWTITTGLFSCDPRY